MRLIPLIIILILSLQTTQAKAATPSQQQVIQLIESSGLELQINQIPEALIQAGKSQSGPASLFVQPLMASLEQVFKPQAMLDNLAKDLVKRLDLSTLLDAMAWYRSTNGRAVINAQKSITQPEVLAKVTQALVQQKLDLNPARQSLLERMAKASHSNQAALDMMVNMQAAFMTGLANMIAPNEAQSFDQFHASFDASKAVLESQLSHQLLIQQSVVLEQLPDELLVEFIEFAETESGQKLFKAINQSLNHTIQNFARNIPVTARTKPTANAPAAHNAH